MDERFYATGRRKNAVARVWLGKGEGKITVNKRPMEEYFQKEITKKIVLQPLVLTETVGQFDLYITVKGGGLSGQAGAVKHGIARALLESDQSLRPVLKKAGMLRRDPRVKERKKYGQKGARARFQFSKR
jgi:small subunit ribosomal protein S9